MARPREHTLPGALSYQRVLAGLLGERRGDPHLWPPHLSPSPGSRGKSSATLKLRARVTGSTPCERQVRGRLFAFCDWYAQNEQVTELATPARTISRWEGEIVTAILTGVTNATAESLNRLARLEARHAHGFRSPASQRRRVRIACTRGTRRPLTRITGAKRRVTR